LSSRWQRGLAGAAASVEQGTLRLHYVQKPIGTERVRDRQSAGDGGLQLTPTSTSPTAAGRVQLAATLRTAADLTRFISARRERSYRFVNVDSAIDIALSAEAEREGGGHGIVRGMRETR
jgi:hypothetical protein